MSMILLYLLLAALLARWVVTAWQDGADRGELAARDAQLRQLREEMDALQTEVRRLSEEQSFMVRLLSKGGGRTDPLPPVERPPDPDPEKP
jgi:hypothetical protein